MEWIDLGCYRVQQILIADLPAVLATIRAARDDGLELPAPAPEAVHIGDAELTGSSLYPCIEIKVSTSQRVGSGDTSVEHYAHPMQIVLTAIDTKPQRLEVRNLRYGLALLTTLNGRGLQPEMNVELIAGNVSYTLLDRLGRNQPFVRSVALELMVTSLTNRDS